MTTAKYRDLTAVLVHAAWADGSSWNNVILLLQGLGLRVRSAQIPLTSLNDDVWALKRLLRQVEGPVLLVGHSYAGAVITAAATDNPQVKALIYIAAIVPDEGEAVGTLFQRAEPNPSVRPHLAPDADGFLWLPPGAFANAVAPDASPEETALMEIAQHPIALATAKLFQEEGARVPISGRDPQTLDAAVRFLGDGVLAVRSDVGKLDDLDKLFETVVQKLGRIDVLFVNAGIAKFAPVAETTERLYVETFETNVKGAFFTIQKAISHLSDGASIILNASFVNQAGLPTTSVYAASKAALRSFARTLTATEHRDRANAPYSRQVGNRTAEVETAEHDWNRRSPKGGIGHRTFEEVLR